MSKNFLWASVHKPMPEELQEIAQSAEKTTVVYLDAVNPDLLHKLSNIPEDVEVKDLAKIAEEILKYCVKQKYILVQCAGSPMFHKVLGLYSGSYPEVKIWDAHSVRKSVDVPQEDGTILKKSIFKHIKFLKF